MLSLFRFTKKLPLINLSRASALDEKPTRWVSLTPKMPASDNRLEFHRLHGCVAFDDRADSQASSAAYDAVQRAVFRGRPASSPTALPVLAACSAHFARLGACT